MTQTSEDVDLNDLLGDLTHFHHGTPGGGEHRACTGEEVGPKDPVHAITCAECIERGQKRICACGAKNIVVSWP